MPLMPYGKNGMGQSEWEKSLCVLRPFNLQGGNKVTFHDVLDGLLMAAVSYTLLVLAMLG